MDRAVTGERPFGTLLRQLRLSAGLSREMLAEHAGLSANGVAALERGERTTPRPTTVSLLAEALKVEPEVRADLLRAAGYSVQASRPARLQVPVAPAALIGRQSELAHASLLLDPGTPDPRLVTLLGPGGVGKTRLALEIASRLGRDYRDGSVFVDLAPLRDAQLVAATIARALAVREAGGQTARDLLVEHIGHRELLLIVDNFEHLPEAAPLMAELLAECPRLKVLVTSRAALRVRGERRLALAPLSAPDPSLSLPAIAAAPAVQLFVERAQAVVPEFALSNTNAGDVARICGHLDGLPLAIELAATRAGLLQPRALLRRLERRLVSLTAGAPDLPERQRTLRNALAWSYELLDPAEQALFRRLSVFAGSFTLRAAEAVCVRPNELATDRIWEWLGGLVDHSLVRRLELPKPEAEPRFDLLQTIREYAAELLTDSGEVDTLRTQHRDWYLAELERAQPGLTSPEQLADLDRDQDNHRAALRWTIQRGDRRAALRLGVACWRVWYWCGRYSEGIAWLDELLATAGSHHDASLRSQALAYAGHLAYCQGDRAHSQKYLDAGLALARTAADDVNIERCSVFLGHLLRQSGDLAAAEERYTLALSLSGPEDAHNIRAAAWRGLARTRYERGDPAGARSALATSARHPVRRDHPKRRARFGALSGRLIALDGDPVRGWRLLEQSLTLLNEIGDAQGLIFAHQLAADTALDGGQRARATYHLEQLLHVARESGERAALARGMEAIAEVLATTQPLRALRLVGTAAAVRERGSIEATPRERERVDRWAPAATKALGQTAAAAALAAGRASSLATVLDEALATCAEFADQRS